MKVWAKDAACSGLNAMQAEAAGCNGSGTVMNSVVDGINVAIGVVGVIAVIMIIVGGITYATSQGDPGKTKKAKDTILYSVVGLIVAIVSFAIVSFLSSSLAK